MPSRGVAGVVTRAEESSVSVLPGRFSWVYDDFTTAGAAEEKIAAPGAGKRILLHTINLSPSHPAASATAALIFRTGGNIFFVYYMPANTLDVRSASYLFDVLLPENANLTTQANGADLTGSVLVSYVVVSA